MKKFLIAFFSVSFFLISCSKKGTPLTYPIVGLWIGTYTANDVDQAPLIYSFDIHSDSTIIIQAQGGDGVTYYQYGTWSLSGTTFTATTVTTDPFGGNNSGVVETETATYSSTEKILSGTWQTPYHIGKFSLERVN